MLKKLGIMVRCAESCNKFTFAMTDEERSELTEEHNSLLSDAERLLRSKTVDLLVLDEFMAAYNGELLDRDLAERVVKAAAEAERVLALGVECSGGEVRVRRQCLRPFLNGSSHRSYRQHQFQRQLLHPIDEGPAECRRKQRGDRSVCRPVVCGAPHTGWGDVHDEPRLPAVYLRPPLVLQRHG